MHNDSGFIKAIQANPEDDISRLVYADWLDESGDIRGQFLRLQLALKSLSPDHLHRVSGEHELSFLRKSIDSGWLAVVEPERAHPGDNPLERRSCQCFKPNSRNRKWRTIEFHKDVQDTECDGWKRLLDLIEEAASDGRTEFAPGRGMDLDDWSRIVTLPATIAKLKSVKRLYLYGSYLVRIPPEIGEMTSLEEFDPYTSYRLHWFPYEITRCQNLRDSRVSTRALYGNFKYRPPFPRLRHRRNPAASRVEPERLSLRHWQTETSRRCSVCNQPFEDRRLHRVWISLGVATDILPLLVNACSEECIQRLPRPADNHVSEPHRGGLEVRQPPPR